MGWWTPGLQGEGIGGMETGVNLFDTATKMMIFQLLLVTCVEKV